jgi:hypothetical protein
MSMSCCTAPSTCQDMSMSIFYCSGGFQFKTNHLRESCGGTHCPPREESTPTAWHVAQQAEMSCRCRPLQYGTKHPLQIALSYTGPASLRYSTVVPKSCALLSKSLAALSPVCPPCPTALRPSGSGRAATLVLPLALRPQTHLHSRRWVGCVWPRSQPWVWQGGSQRAWGGSSGSHPSSPVGALLRVCALCHHIGLLIMGQACGRQNVGGRMTVVRVIAIVTDFSAKPIGADRVRALHHGFGRPHALLDALQSQPVAIFAVQVSARARHQAILSHVAKPPRLDRTCGPVDAVSAQFEGVAPPMCPLRGRHPVPRSPYNFCTRNAQRRILSKDGGSWSDHLICPLAGGSSFCLA